ncbi:MAG: bifunctional riboflavin kinase/FAD synthetase [Actinomycetes bacterium]|jgi:riboflavin kinase/FMN adenylyltransferase
MDVLAPTEPTLPPAGSIVTIGVYDGVHRGHQRTLGRVVSEAKAKGLRSVVATFDRHPAEVVRPEHAPLLLCDLDQRLELLDNLGVDTVAVIPFDSARALETAHDFIANVLVGQLGAAKVIVGEDFRFGHDRLGDVDLLRAAGDALGFEVEGVVLGESDGDPISSTRIRTLIADGSVAEAAVLLGRLHQVRGPVLAGDGRGGPELGCPTANVHVPDAMALPAVGIYAGFYEDDAVGRWPAAISIGRRPTFYASADPLVEVHLIGFSGDLYGHAARVSFLARLRDEERFDSVGDLIAQMQQDIEVSAILCADHFDT